MLVSSTSNDSSSPCYGKVEGEVVGSRPIGCMGNISIKSKKGWQHSYQMIAE